MGRQIGAALLNFFTLGLGYLFFGTRKIFGALMFLGALPAVYVEFSLQGENETLYWASFASFFILAVATAIDGWKDAASNTSKASSTL